MKAIMKASKCEPTEDIWQIEEDARIIERYADLKSKNERFDKAVKFLKDKNIETNKIINGK